MTRDAVPRLSLEHVTHRYNARWAVRDLSLHVGAGELVCLLGPSGCGKTTTLRIAAGVERQTEGRVLIDGEEVAGLSRHVPPEKRSVGLIFQDYALFPHLTVRQNVEFGLRALSGRERTVRAWETLEVVGLATLADVYPHTLSGGEQQRVALARALAPRPRIMLMDEPFSGLDRRLRDSVRDETLGILKGMDTATLLVTHDPEEAMRMADRIVLMKDGAVVQSGSPTDLYRHPANAETASFLSPINVLHTWVEGNSAPTPLGAVPAPRISAGTEVEVLIRPHLIRIGQEGAAATVRRSRILGEEGLVELKLHEGGDRLQARVSADALPDEGRTVHVTVPVDQLLVYPCAHKRLAPDRLKSS